MGHRPDPAARLIRALCADARSFGLTLHPQASDERPWASATFTGRRIVLRLALAGGDARAWLAALPEADLPVPDHLVADCVVTSADRGTVTLEVLLLDACR